MVTDVDLRVVDLDENLNPWRVLRRPLACLIGLDLVPRRRAWLPTADVHVQCSGDQDLVLLGLIREDGEELIETLQRYSRLPPPRNET